jgi:hypothetical protein
MSDREQMFEILDKLDEEISRAQLMKRILAKLANEAEREHNCLGPQCQICGLVRMAREIL